MHKLTRSVFFIALGVVLPGAAFSACSVEPDDSTDATGGRAGESGQAGTSEPGGAPGRGGEGGETGTTGGTGQGGSGATGGARGGRGGGGGNAGGSGGTGDSGGAGGGEGGASGDGGEGGSDPGPQCGDGVVEGNETCEDQNADVGDGCVDCAIEPGWACDDSRPSVCVPEIVSIAGGGAHTCAVLGTGKMLCWGSGSPYEQTGYADWHNIGDDETPASFGPLRINGSVKDVAAGTYHTCALMTSGAVRCWGDHTSGQLGYADMEYHGDASLVGDIDVGGPVKQVVCGEYHTCALLTNDKVRCWGWGATGHPNNFDYIGDDETPASVGDVNVGGPVQQIAAGWAHTCALLTTGAVRCWGDPYLGVLGYGNSNYIGDDETPASAGDVNVGGTVSQIVAGGLHTCALLTTGRVRCWGAAGAVGYGNSNVIGDDETPASAGDVDVGVLAERIVSGGYHTCVVTAARTVHCWGGGPFGATGYATPNAIGDDELPSSKGAVNVGGPVGLLAAGIDHTCAVLPGSKLRCWGRNENGQLGYGNGTENVGDDETPASAGFVEYY